MIVRKPQPTEFDSTVNLFHYYRDEAIESLPEIEQQYDENSMIQTIRMFMSHYEYIWFNAYENSRPVGFIAGYITQCPWNLKRLECNIAFIYLLESHRNMDNFRLLIKEFEAWARSVKASAVTAGDIGINPARTQRLYEHFGYKPGVWMGKELTDE